MAIVTRSYRLNCTKTSKEVENEIKKTHSYNLVTRKAPKMTATKGLSNPYL